MLMRIVFMSGLMFIPILIHLHAYSYILYLIGYSGLYDDDDVIALLLYAIVLAELVLV